MDNPIYDVILPHGEQESEFIARNNGIYNTPEDLKHTYMSDLQCSMEDSVYEQESEFIARNSGIYDTQEDLKYTYMSDLQCSMEDSVNENPSLGVHSPMVRASHTYFDNFVCVLTKTFPYVTPTGKWCSIGMLLSC